ncbi:MAG: flagellar biosynthesis anti-sigma factor FlgM [Deltaproteobacteria bacterium]|nr:flagellar biosynthesis anti-sigma factor FlgM [Deltaproteobacteria bacterium]
MEITGGNPFNKIDGYVKQVNKEKSKSSAVSDDQSSSKVLPSGDSVELSTEAKIMQEAIKVLGTLPDVREEKVEQIKQQIADGTYEIDSKKISEKMITESVVNNLT